MSTKIAVVGPSGAGKSVYLACLMRAALSARIAERPIKVRPDNPNANTLFQQATAILCGHPPPATVTPSETQIIVDLPGSWLFGLGAESLELSVIDMPGGDSLPPVGQALPAAIQQIVGDAQALMVIVSADPRSRCKDLGPRLEQLLRFVEPMREPGERPFLRAAVVVTMSELIVHKRGSAALATLDAIDAQKVARKLCGEAFIDVVERLVPVGGEGYSLVSAYGFDDQGRPAVQAHADGWRLMLDKDGFRDRWVPYRVFEPLEFLARGLCWRETYSVNQQGAP